MFFFGYDYHTNYLFKHGGCCTKYQWVQGALGANGANSCGLPSATLYCRAGRYMPRGATYKDLKQAKLTLKSTRFYMPNKYLD